MSLFSLDRNDSSIFKRKYGFKELLMFASIFAIASIIVLNLLCSDNPHRVSSSSHRNDQLKKWVQMKYLKRTFYRTDLDTTTNLDLLEHSEIDRILLKTFGYDYEDYHRFKSNKISMKSFDFLFRNDSHNVFNLHKTDVLVFLHMQKTGGSAFDRHLVRDLILPQPCKCDSKRKKKCRCFRPGTMDKYWLFSRYSIGWKCGLHADYTELTNCVDRILNQFEHTKEDFDRNYYFVTLLRDPIARFLSEFKHVQRGATWKTSRHWCDGRLPTIKEIPFCFKGSNWKNVSFDEFLSCQNNLAFNRQTRMLADLSLVGCYNKSVMSPEERDSVMLFSAKQNLKRMSFFGLCEEQLATQYMFERAFKFHFRRPFVQFNQTRSHATLKSLNFNQIEQIRRLNHLDVKLYSYAKDLFRKRFAMIKEMDPNFNDYYRELSKASQMLLQKTKSTPSSTRSKSSLKSSPQSNRIDHDSESESLDSNYIDYDMRGGVGVGDSDDNLDLEDSSSALDSIDENDSVEDYYV
ncbi:Heparan-sulfate 6-O-sulfotransferase 2 [Sarcoptes scabiei]|uniref:Heparan-sulfate 6-O-sulfotransferase n=1 Tax=Sarcoptes scabiei TaxID=52283 RepID=A0A834R5L1_SARSC|nr:Heparan-sulfate 6-O-sulfotransferase 2 [Sarcoptes scabiei]UXI19865.1 hypothetical protein NH340_JMT05809 [Sarcoptes scabiei]